MNNPPLLLLGVVAAAAAERAARAARGSASIILGGIYRGSSGGIAAGWGRWTSTFALVREVQLLLSKESFVVSKLLAPCSSPALRAKPWLCAASAGNGFVGAQAVLTAGIGGVLLETSAIEVEGLGAASPLAIAELVAIIRIAEGARPFHLTPAPSGLGTLAALGVGLMVGVAFVFAGFQTVLITKRPVFLLAECLGLCLFPFLLLGDAEASADGAALHDLRDEGINLLCVAWDFSLFVILTVTRLQVADENSVLVLVPIVAVGVR